MGAMGSALAPSNLLGLAELGRFAVGVSTGVSMSDSLLETGLLVRTSCLELFLSGESALTLP